MENQVPSAWDGNEAHHLAITAARGILADSEPGIEGAARVTAIWTAKQIMVRAGYPQTALLIARGIVNRIEMEDWSK